MRITTPQITALMHGSMNANSERLGKLMQQMATGERLLMPSDDPIASVRLLRVEREQASLSQYANNIANLSDSLSIQEANLSAASDTMLRAQDLLLWAANRGANSDEDLAAIASELNTLKDTIVSFINVRDEEGRYLFSGTLSDRPAVTFTEDDGYTLNGNDKYRQAAVANGVLVEENVTAHQFFGGAPEFLNTLDELVQTLQAEGLDGNDPAVGQQITDALDKLDDTHGRILGAITELGGRQNSLSLLAESNADVSVVNEKIEGELSRLDYGSAAIDLSNYQLALQATQKTYLKINGLSLFAQM